MGGWSQEAIDTNQINSYNLLARKDQSLRPDSALNYAQLAFKRSQELAYVPGEAESSLIQGEILAYLGFYSEASEFLFKALELYQELRHVTGQIETLNQLGSLYYFTLQPEESLQYYQKALAMARQKNLSSMEAATLGNLGHFYEKKQNYEQALAYQFSALAIYERLQDPQGLSTISGNLGSIYEDFGEYDKAHRYFSQALEYNRLTDNELDRIIHLNNISDTQRKRGHYQQAILPLEESYALAIKLNNPYHLRSSLKDFSKIYAGLGDYKTANAYLEKAFDQHEILYNTENALQLARWKSFFETKEKESQIEILQREKRLDQITLYASISGVIMLVLLSFLLFSRQRLKFRNERELYETRQELIRQELENSRLSEQQLKLDLETKTGELSNHALHLIQKNKMLKELKTKLAHLEQQNSQLKRPVDQLIRKIDESFRFDQDWETFNNIFDQVHPEFYRKLMELYPDLSSSEIRLCALLKLNLEPREISHILGISKDSLRVTRHRLRKKMGLERKENLTSVIMAV